MQNLYNPAQQHLPFLPVPGELGRGRCPPAGTPEPPAGTVLGGTWQFPDPTTAGGGLEVPGVLEAAPGEPAAREELFGVVFAGLRVGSALLERGRAAGGLFPTMCAGSL